jgi:hypothetical protein
MGCTGFSKEQGRRCDKCLQPEKDIGAGASSSAAPAAAVEFVVCEYCSVKPANGNTKYCEDCVVKLEEALGLADDDEEKHKDGVGGSAEPSTAPGVPVEPPSAAPAGSGAGGDGAAETAAAAPLPPVVCARCRTKPATRESHCDRCHSVLEECAKERVAMKEAEKQAHVYFRSELEECNWCDVASRKFCVPHGSRVHDYIIDMVRGTGSATSTARGGTVEQGDAAWVPSPEKDAAAEGRPDAPGGTVERCAGGDGTTTTVVKRRNCEKMQCTNPAKDGSTYCERCGVEWAVHLEYFEKKSGCFKCFNTGTGAYCDKHHAEMNAEIEKRMAKQTNEVTAVEHILCYRCTKKPIADECKDYCNDCLAKMGLA